MLLKCLKTLGTSGMPGAPETLYGAIAINIFWDHSHTPNTNHIKRRKDCVASDIFSYCTYA